MEINRSVKEIRRVDTGGNCEKARIIYVVSGCGSAESAVEAVRMQAPETIGKADKRTIEITSSPGGGVFEVAADYTISKIRDNDSRRERKSGDRVWRLIANTVPAVRDNSLGTVRSLDISGILNVQPGSRIHWNGKNGQESRCGTVKVLEPHFTEICRATFRVSRINTAYKRRLIAAVGKVNANTFHNWQPGEVLLESVTQSDIFTNSAGHELCDLLFEFAIRPNGIRRCAGYDVLDVDGWDHVWAISEYPAGGSAEEVHSLHISRIYERCSFNVLEI